MTKLEIIDAIASLDVTCIKVKCMADELANEHFSTNDIKRNINLMVFQFPTHQTLFTILHDYTAQLQQQICELQVMLEEGGIEV